MSTARIDRRGVIDAPMPNSRRPDDATIYAQHADELIRFATMLVGPSGAEDVVADAVVRVFASPQWPGVGARRAYLFRAVLRQAQMARRSTERRLKREIKTASNETVPGPDGLSADLLRAIRALSIRQRAVVFMTHWLDEPPTAIATALHVSVRTVQRDLVDAYRQMEGQIR